jgi:hypothetical protein
MIAGFVGLVSLIVQNWSNGPQQKLHAVTLVFGIPAGMCLAVIFYGICAEKGKIEDSAVGLAILLPGFLILSVIYADWALGAMTHNLAGMPSSDPALYYLYWISKRLTMLSW